MKPARTPYPYQLDGAAFLALKQRAGLADDAGLGKTGQAITALRHTGARTVRIACPAVARNVWRQELREWWPSHGVHNIDIRSYDELALHKELRVAWAAARPDVLICDEAHYLKNPQARRSKSIYGPGCRGERGITAACGAVWLLTATPAPNHPGELWTHYRALRPDLITQGGAPMDYWQFLMHYCDVQANAYGLTPRKVKRQSELRHLFGTMWLRRRWQEVLTDLPEWTWQHVSIEASNTLEALREWERLHPEVAEAAREIEEHGAAGPAGLHLASYRHWVGTVKAPAVARMLEAELRSGAVDKLVVFAHHHDCINTLHAGLDAYEPVQITGKTPEGARAAAIDLFQTDPNCRVAILQTQAAGVAITLTAARHVVFAEPEWVPADMYQAAKRVHRIGQRHPVLVRVIGLNGSIDDVVAAVCARKAQMISVLESEQPETKECNQ